MVLYCTVAPFVLIFLAINEIVRVMINLLIGFKYLHGQMKLVPDGIDGCFLSKEKSYSANELIMIRFKKENIDFTQFFQHAKARIIDFQDENGVYVFEKFRWILVEKFGYPCWKLDEQFDFVNHIKSAGGEKKSESDLKMYISQLSHDMDDRKPQWEIILYDYRGRFLLPTAHLY